MSIDAADRPRVTLRAKANETNAGDTSFEVSRRGVLEVAAADGSDPEVNVANGLNSVDFPLPDGIDMRVDQDTGDGVSDIEYVDEDGNVVGEYFVDDETESGQVVDGTADFDAESGEFDVTEEFAEAEEVDENALAWLGEDADGASSDESGDSADAEDSTGSGGGADESGVDEPGADESGADEPGADETGVDETGVDESGADESGADEPGADESGADEPGVDESGADEPGAEEEEDPGA
jgi:hypothetical protein